MYSDLRGGLHSSTEIWISATIAGLSFYLFVIHTVTATDRSFLNRDLLEDGNFVARTVMMFLGRFRVSR